MSDSPRSPFPTFQIPDGPRVFCTTRTAAQMVCRELFPENSYLKHGIAVHDGDCIFDIGANIGLFVLSLTRHCQTARVFAFEPIPEICQVLERNLQDHCPFEVKLFRHGVSNTLGNATFYYYPRNSIASTMYPDDGPEGESRSVQFTLNEFATHPNRLLAWFLRSLPEWARYALAKRVQKWFFARAKSFTCPLTTISQVLRDHRVPSIDLLKIDAERCEHDILAGIVAADWPTIRQAVVEVHEGDAAVARVRRILETHGLSTIVEASPYGPDLHTVYARR